jgi:SAM-dependent methyltransferase
MKEILTFSSQGGIPMNESFKWSPGGGRSQEEVDRINKAFYGKFNYPWPPMAFYAFPDQEFVITMLNQDIGDWEHKTVPARPKIWVAGCGTNQAVFVALKFPDSAVLGTDLSAESLKTCESSASQLGVTNLTLEEKSINRVQYEDEFDFIICTGVIHHNADPKTSLGKLSTALKPGGILELMVYNRYHMLFEASYQEAVRLLYQEERKNEIAFDAQLATTKQLIKNFPSRNLLADHLAKFREIDDDAELADMLIQPVLHSYTIETFAEMIANSDLEYLLPCVNQFDKVK